MVIIGRAVLAACLSLYFDYGLVQKNFEQAKNLSDMCIKCPYVNRAITPYKLRGETDFRDQVMFQVLSNCQGSYPLILLNVGGLVLELLPACI